MGERFIRLNNLLLWTESFGNPEHPAVLLIMGASCQGILWPTYFCNKLANHGFFVLRYDHRDTGKSSFIDSPQPYTLEDMSQDAKDILSSYGVKKAHLVGVSMGGFIAQLQTLQHPEHVMSLTCIMSSPDQRPITAALFGEPKEQYSLPGPSEEILSAFHKLNQNKQLLSREQWIENQIDYWHTLNGNKLEIDRDFLRNICQEVWERDTHEHQVFSHVLAVATSESRINRLHEIDIPCLVIHGKADPLIPFEHGVAIAKSIPKSKLLLLEDMGHMMHPQYEKLMMHELLNLFQQV